MKKKPKPPLTMKDVNFAAALAVRRATQRKKVMAVYESVGTLHVIQNAFYDNTSGVLVARVYPGGRGEFMMTREDLEARYGPTVP